jgi:DNA-binding SARP family transcriptional activator/predicted ATPase
MEPQRYLRCLGQPALFAATGEPIRFRTRKHLALLVYLAVESRPHRRDRLAEFFWPKVSTSDARHSLATALSTLRPRLGLEGLEASRDHVRLLPGRVRLDLERLEAGDVLGTEITGPLEVAAFLDGFDFADSAEFTLWKDRQQARLLPGIKDALVVLIDRCRRNGESRQIEQLADRMLALDDLSEEAIRAKMEARAFAGDRLTALEIFEEWKAKLAEDLQAVPSDLVEGMAVRLRRRGWERTTLANIPNVPTDQWRGRPFIGRTAEYRVLYEAWEGVRKGVPGHALILGDSGVGKTTLVQRLTTAAGLEGAAISRVQCYDVEREIPYSTLSSLVVGLLDSPGVSATSPEALAELARAVPSVRRRFPNIPPPSEAQGETARIRLTEAFLEMLIAIAEEHPVILVVDDLHLADDVSLAVLHFIIRRSRQQPLMVVFLARPGELSESPQAARLRENSVSLGIHEVPVIPLSESESRQMLSSLIQSDEPTPGITEQRALLRAAAGYPMVLELLVQDWKVSGEHSLARALDAMTAEFQSGPAQASYRQILDRITRSLDNTTHNVLNLASILGPRLNDLALYALVDLSRGQTMSAMSELVRRRVLRDGTQGLEFVNEFVRESAYAGVPGSMRRILHGNVADFLLRQKDSGTGDLDLETAWHCIRGGRVDEAISHLLRGARRSVERGALHSAERALSTAIPNLQGKERSDAVILLVEVLQEQGRWRESIELLEKPETEHSREAKLVFSIQARHWSTEVSASETYDDLNNLLSIIETGSTLRLRIKAAKASALLTSSLRDPKLAETLVESLSRIPTPLAIDDLARLADSKAQLLFYAFQRRSCLNELTQIAERLGDQELVNTTMASLHTGMGVLACSAGKYPEGKAEFLQAHNICARLGNDSVGASRAAQVALCCYRLGEYTEGIEWGTLASRTFCQIPFAGYVECQTARHNGSCYALLGNERSAREVISGFELRMPQSSQVWMKQAWHLHKADILLYLGKESEALSAADEGVGGENPTLHDMGFAGAFARWLAVLSKHTSRQVHARLIVQRLARSLEKLDAVDQVEVLCAVLLLGCTPDRKESLTKSLDERLDALPSPITKQLLRLQVLPPNLARHKTFQDIGGTDCKTAGHWKEQATHYQR